MLLFKEKSERICCRPSEHPPGRGVKNIVVSHIQRIGCQTEKTTLHGGQSRSWTAEQGKKEKKNSGSALPPHSARSEKRKYISRDASICLGASQFSVRLASVRINQVRLPILLVVS